jgi:HK97 family phage major capsid protein/HK97 family phage prohead protease
VENDILTLPAQFRFCRVEAVATKNRTIKVSFSSETPVERSYGNEILSHAPGAADLSRFKGGRGPLLLDHDHKQQIGSIRQAWIDSQARKGYAHVRFSASPAGEEIWQQVLDGDRSNTSVGYRVLELARRSDEDFVATKWLPFEISMVSVPADDQTYVEKSLLEPYEVRILDRDQPTRIKVMDQTSDNDGAPGNSSEPRSRRSGTVLERERVTDILALTRQFARSAGMEWLEPAGQDAIRDGTSADSFRAEMLTRMPKTPPLGRGQADSVYVGNNYPPNILTHRAQSYSLLKAIRQASQLKPLDGLEAETSQELSRSLGRNPNGFFVPDSYFARDLLAGSSAIVPTILEPTLIDLLRKQMVLGRAGATPMGGLIGNVLIPRQSGAATAQWLSEVAAVTESDQSFDQVSLSPKRLAAQTYISKTLIAQSSLDAEGIVRNDLTKILAIAIDLAGLFGTGVTNNQPLGLMNQTGVSTVTFGGAPTFQAAVNFEAALEEQNALMGALAYITSPGVKSMWKVTPLIGGTPAFPKFLWQNNQVNDYDAYSTNQVPSTGTGANLVFFGNWADLLIGSWAGLDIVVDPYTQAGTGQIVVTAMQLIDVAIRHPQSFCVSTDAGNQ